MTDLIPSSSAAHGLKPPLKKSWWLQQVHRSEEYDSSSFTRLEFAILAMVPILNIDLLATWVLINVFNDPDPNNTIRNFVVFPEYRRPGRKFPNANR